MASFKPDKASDDETLEFMKRELLKSFCRAADNQSAYHLSSEQVAGIHHSMGAMSQAVTAIIEEQRHRAEAQAQTLKKHGIFAAR